MAERELKPGDAFMHNGHSFRGHMFVFVKDIDMDPVFFDTIDGKVYRVELTSFKILLNTIEPHPVHKDLPKFDYIKNIDPKVFEWVAVNTEHYISKNGPLNPVTLD